MISERERARSKERLEAISRSSLDSESLRREAITVLQRTIGFDRWCWPLADPRTLLPLSGLAEHDFGRGVARTLELEYSGDDFAAKHVLARRPNPAGSLHDETGGDLARSPRWDEVMRPVGMGDVATVACRDSLGCWGWVEAYRDGSDRCFEEEDLQLLAAVGPMLGSALRRNTAPGGRRSGHDERAPGVIVLDPELRALSWTATARSWIDALPGAAMFTAWGMLPAIVYPAATLARSGAAEQANALLHTVEGSWMAIEAAPLEGEAGGGIAVTLRAATPSETFDLLCRVYALSRRERDVVAALVAGFDTRGVGRRLFISRHTVQDHLKSVFAKLGIHSRRELLARFSAAEQAVPPPAGAGDGTDRA